MKILLTDTAFDPWKEIESYQSAFVHLNGKFGATAIFIGTMRDFNEGASVKKMNLEHYPGMTEKYLETIASDAIQRWDLLDCLVIHRVGTISPSDPIVLVAVWSHHRGNAFDACRHIMEELKNKAPFWKKEHTEDSARWVDKNTCGY